MPARYIFRQPVVVNIFLGDNDNPNGRFRIQQDSNQAALALVDQGSVVQRRNSSRRRGGDVVERRNSSRRRENDVVHRRNSILSLENQTLEQSNTNLRQQANRLQRKLRNLRLQKEDLMWFCLVLFVIIVDSYTGLFSWFVYSTISTCYRYLIPDFIKSILCYTWSFIAAGATYIAIIGFGSVMFLLEYQFAVLTLLAGIFSKAIPRLMP